MKREVKMWKCNCGCVNDTEIMRCERCNREKTKGIDVIIFTSDDDYKEMLVDRKNNRDHRKRRKYDGSK